MKANLFFTDEDIQALSLIDFDIEIVNQIRSKLDAFHERVYRQQTGEFLAHQYQKLMKATDKDEKVKLMWEIVEWKQNYKSPYRKE